jgi:hypothetical protein
MRSIEGEMIASKKIPALGPDETATLAARPEHIALPGGEPWLSPLLLLTDKRFIVSKNRRLGKAKIDFEVPWTQVHRVVAESPGMIIPLDESDDTTTPPDESQATTTQLIVRSEHGEIQLAVRSQNASDVNAAIRKGYLAAGLSSLHATGSPTRTRDRDGRMG